MNFEGPLGQPRPARVTGQRPNVAAQQETL
jgi:hypothetical protein